MFGTRAPAHRAPAGGPERPPGAQAQLPCRAGTAGVRERPVHRRGESARARRRIPLREAGSLPRGGGARCRGTPERWASSSTEGQRPLAEAVAAEVDRLLAGEVVRDRQTGLRRPAQPGDIAILFRARESHREFEQALISRRIPTYVYKGLGFFDADETKDVAALLRYLADPWSDLRAAAFLRSRFVRLSDAAVRHAVSRTRQPRSWAPGCREPRPRLDDEDRGVLLARSRVRGGMDRAGRSASARGTARPDPRRERVRLRD